MRSHKGSDGRRFLIEDFPLRLTMANIRLITLKKKITYRPNYYHYQMKKKVLAAIALVVWLVIIAVFSLLASRVDLEIFFVLWLIGLLIIVELMDMRFSLPSYLRYIKYLVAAGIVVFGAIVTQKVLEILAP